MFLCTIAAIAEIAVLVGANTSTNVFDFTPRWHWHKWLHHQTLTSRQAPIAVACSIISTLAIIRSTTAAGPDQQYTDDQTELQYRCGLYQMQPLWLLQ